MSEHQASRAEYQGTKAAAGSRCPPPGTETVDQKGFGFVGCGSTNIRKTQDGDWYKCQSCGMEFTGEQARKAEGTEALLREGIAVPPDRDAKALVAAILEKAQAPGGEDRHLFRIRLVLIHDNAARLKVLLAERDAEVVAALEAAETTMMKSYRGGLDSSGFGLGGSLSLVRAALARVKGKA